MIGRRFVRDALIITINTLVLVALIEGGLRAAYLIRNSTVDVMVLPYTAAQDWGVLPPWIDGLRILEDDPVLLWKNRPGARRSYLDVYGPAHGEDDRVAIIQQFIPRIPETLRGQPKWDVEISPQGFRNAQFSPRKAPAAFRIVCLGDSWTFGANVSQQDAYPQRLAALLTKKYPQASFEVLNLGVMGYTSRQGLELLRRQVLDLQPDLVLIGFAMNDAIVQGWRDRDAVGIDQQKTPRTRRWYEYLESYKLGRYLQSKARYKPWSIGDYLLRVSKEDGTPDAIWTGRQASESADYDAIEDITRVSPRDYEANLTTMVDLARRGGAEVILMFNELWGTPYQKIVEKVAQAQQAPFVNSKALIDELRHGAERELETRFGLQPPAAAAAPPDGLVEIVFRVQSDRWPVQTSLFIAGNHPSLADGVPNRVALHDDGTHGDQRAGDGVWSQSARFRPGARVFYVYTNSGREGHWEGVDVPDLRFLVVPQEGPVYRPIEAFGSLRFQADGWHTNATGYELIAKTVAHVIEEHPRVRVHLAR